VRYQIVCVVSSAFLEKRRCIANSILTEVRAVAAVSWEIRINSFRILATFRALRSSRRRSARVIAFCLGIFGPNFFNFHLLLRSVPVIGTKPIDRLPRFSIFVTKGVTDLLTRQKLRN
jgi:hypothetical protein